MYAVTSNLVKSVNVYDILTFYVSVQAENIWVCRYVRLIEVEWAFCSLSK